MSWPLKLLLLAIATLLMGALAVSNQSFWIDEGTAAVKALEPSLPDLWHALRVEGHSNLQLLPHFLYIWGWEKVLGASEISLRAANLPLLFAGLAAALWALERWPRLQFWFCALALVNAFTWYYTSEARPYVLLFAASCLALGALVKLSESGPDESTRRTLPLFYLGLFLVSATSLIAVPWAVSWLACAVVLLGFPQFLALLRQHIAASLCFVVGMSALAVYYAWTISIGARASGHATTSLANFVFILYEQLGLAGLGPGRTELRSEGGSTLRSYAIPLALGTTAALLACRHAFRAIPGSWWKSRAAAAAIVGIVVPLGLVLAAGYVAHVRILGRHLTSFFPVVLFVLALGMRRMQMTTSGAQRLALVLIPLVFLLSSLQVRFAPRHARDDYRGAAQLALAAAVHAGSVWWMADLSTGIFYGLKFGQPESGVVAPHPGQIARFAEPRMIVLSKSDIYDPENAVARYAEAHGFVQSRVLPSFRILEKPNATP